MEWHKIAQENWYTEEVAENPNTSPDILRKILEEGNGDWVSWYAASNPNCPPEALKMVLERGKNDIVSEYAALNPNCPSDALKMVLERGKDDLVSAAAAGNLNCPPDALKMVMERGNDDSVSWNAAENPNCPPLAKIKWKKATGQELTEEEEMTEQTTKTEELKATPEEIRNFELNYMAKNNSWYKTAWSFVYNLLDRIQMQGEHGLSLLTMDGQELEEAKELEREGFINKVIINSKEGQYSAYVINKKKFEERGWRIWNSRHPWKYISAVKQNEQTAFNFLESTKGIKPPKDADPEYRRIKERSQASLEELAKRYKNINAFMGHLKWIGAKFERVDNKVVVYVDGKPHSITFPTTSQFNLMAYRTAKARKKMIIARGCPGSGKSTMAKELGQGGVVYAGDDYFMVGNKYIFDEDKLMDAHKWNLKRTEKAAKNGITPIVIDNTNLVPEDAQPYIQIGVKYGYEIEIAEPDTPWKFDADELAKRNKHGVTKESIERKLKRYTPYTVEDALNAEPRKED